MEVRNVMEKMVWDNLDRVLGEVKLSCDCEKCRADVVAFALNRLKPRYVTTDRGETISKAMNLEFQAFLDVIAALTVAAELVGKHPRHELDLE